MSLLISMPVYSQRENTLAVTSVLSLSPANVKLNDLGTTEDYVQLNIGVEHSLIVLKKDLIKAVNALGYERI